MLNNFFKFLNQNAGALTVFFTAVVTISTLVYAILTAVLVKETKKMRKVQTEPRIEIILKPFDFAINFVRLRIKNIGLGPAIYLNFKLSVVSGGEYAEKLLSEFTETNFFNTGLRYFGPNQEMFSNFSNMSEDYEQKIKSILLFDIEYKSVTGEIYKEQIIVDLSEMKGINQLGKPNLYSIAQSLEKIQKTINSITNGFNNRLEADIYTQEDREREHEERIQHIKKQKERKNGEENA